MDLGSYIVYFFSTVASELKKPWTYEKLALFSTVSEKISPLQRWVCCSEKKYLSRKFP